MTRVSQDLRRRIFPAAHNAGRQRSIIVQQQHWLATHSCRRYAARRNSSSGVRAAAPSPVGASSVSGAMASVGRWRAIRVLQCLRSLSCAPHRYGTCATGLKASFTRNSERTVDCRPPILARLFPIL